MLKKLLKYDLSSIFKFLIIFYSLSIIFAVSSRFFLSFEKSLAMEIIGRIFSGAAISMMFSTIINNLMRLWVRFKTNFYNDESYLTHTLPVKRTTQYLSKFITAVITMVVSISVIALSLFISYYSKENMDFVKSLLFPLADSINISTFGLVFALILLIFLEFLNILQCGFTGLILGHSMNSKKMGMSVLFGFIASLVTQFALLLVLFAFALFNDNVMNMFITNSPVDFTTFKLLAIIAIVVYMIIICAVCLFNLKQFKRGVNVD
ncbi:MAG: hypothetical protein IKM46_05330 [Clostridia bacterium]|nr:hypothetical protein [Clostridia bacterium]